MKEKNYIQNIRRKVGHEKIFLNFSCACITNNQGEILLQKRSGTKEEWGFPGGALELGESAEMAVIREVKEETGFKIHVDELIGVYSLYFDKYPNGDESQNIITFFKCSIDSGKPHIDNEETFALKFFSKENIPKLFRQQHQDMLEDFLENKRGVYR